MSFIKQTGNLSSAPKVEPKIVRYDGGVPNASGVKGGLFGRENVVKNMQKIYQAGNQPVHLKTPRDRLMYKGIMYGSMVGLLFGMVGFYKIAMPKKN